MLEKGRSIDMIGETRNHQSVLTTKAYLREISVEVLDELSRYCFVMTNEITWLQNPCNKQCLLAYLIVTRVYLKNAY
jgi:hypothetical protein